MSDDGQPKNEKMVSVATPFSITGSLKNPNINVDKQATGQRAAAEVMAMPMNIISNLMGVNKQGESEWKGKPCVVPKAKKKQGTEVPQAKKKQGAEILQKKKTKELKNPQAKKIKESKIPQAKKNKKSK